jgi:uncharacterized protein YcbK (DUF882 family)
MATEIKGNVDGVNPDIIMVLHGVMERTKKDIIVTSGYRPGDPGTHGRGQAVDIVSPGTPLMELYLIAERFNFTGIGMYPMWTVDNSVIVGGLHLDLRTDSPARWMGLGTDKKQQYIALNVENLKKHGVI